MIIPVYITLKGELNLLRPVLASTSHTYLFISMHQMVITSTQWHRTQVSSLSPTLYCLLLPRLSCYCALYTHTYTSDKHYDTVRKHKYEKFNSTYIFPFQSALCCKTKQDLTVLQHSSVCSRIVILYSTH